jgi:endonuclease YncB( thermonuclease family)
MIKKAVIRHPEYRFMARIDRWVDGDTAEITVYLGSRFEPIDIGFGLKHKIADEYAGTFRLYGINAPEKYKTGGSAATAMARAIAPEGSELEIVTSKDPDSFGRYVAELWTSETTSVNQTMVASGHAVIYPEPKVT